MIAMQTCGESFLLFHKPPHVMQDVAYGLCRTVL